MSSSNNLCSAFDYATSHTTLLDPTTGSLVCTSCAHVLQEGLTYEELHLKNCWKFDEKCHIMIDGEPAIEFLNKVGEIMHLCSSTINNAHHAYLKVRNKIQLCEQFSIFISSVIVLDPIYF